MQPQKIVGVKYIKDDEAEVNKLLSEGWSLGQTVYGDETWIQMMVKLEIVELSAHPQQ